MENFLLMMSVGAVFVFGIYLMKRFGTFIEKNEKEVCNGFYINEDCLHIALASPLMEVSISKILDKFSGIYPSTEIEVFTGGREAVLNRLMKGMADVAILPDGGDTGSLNGCNHIHISAKQILWPEKEFPNNGDRFVSCFLGGTARERDGMKIEDML